MHSLGFMTLFAGSSPELTAVLPWGWYAALAAVDVGLLAVFVRQLFTRRRARRSNAVTRVQAFHHQLPPQTGLTWLVLRNGWWIPGSRWATLPPHHSTREWPVHRNYLRSRIG